MQEGFVANFSELPGWNQTMIFSALQQLSDIMNAGSIPADPILMVKPLSKAAAGKSR
jgi:hypothetical protein